MTTALKLSNLKSSLNLKIFLNSAITCTFSCFEKEISSLSCTSTVDRFVLIPLNLLSLLSLFFSDYSSLYVSEYILKKSERLMLLKVHQKPKRDLNLLNKKRPGIKNRNQIKGS